MPGKEKILLALKNDEESKAFTAYLFGMGYETSIAKDGARALETAIQESPAIIIADSELPVISGDRLFQILRNNPHTSKIPFLFVADAIIDVKGFRTGVDIFLVRPLNMEELHVRIRQTLSTKESGGFTSGEIEGQLRQMSLADILQFLHLNKKEGVLKISAGDTTGSVFIKDGQIYNAVSGGVEKEKALFRLLQWTDGKFEFLPSPIAITKKIQTSTGNLLMEGMRQIDEFKKSSESFPGRKMTIKARVEESQLPQGLQPVVYEIFQLLKTYGRVEEIVENCTYTDYEVYKTILAMLSKGILEESKVKGESFSETIDFLTHDQSISIREKIISRFSDTHSLNYGKIFLIATSGNIVEGFIELCRRIPGFKITYKSASFTPTAKENPLGTIAILKLYGGMEIHLFSIPTVKNMGPLWKSFSSNLIGLILLWDEEGGKDIKEVVDAKQEILLQRRVPVVHVFADMAQDADGGHKKAFNLKYKKAFNLKLDEPIFKMDTEMIFEIFYALFSTLIKEDYVTT